MRTGGEDRRDGSDLGRESDRQPVSRAVSGRSDRLCRAHRSQPSSSRRRDTSDLHSSSQSACKSPLGQSRLSGRPNDPPSCHTPAPSLATSNESSARLSTSFRWPACQTEGLEPLRIPYGFASVQSSTCSSSVPPTRLGRLSPTPRAKSRRSGWSAKTTVAEAVALLVFVSAGLPDEFRSCEDEVFVEIVPRSREDTWSASAPLETDPTIARTRKRARKATRRTGHKGGSVLAGHSAACTPFRMTLAGSCGGP